MSRSDAYLRVTCDTCEVQEEDIPLTALAGDAWDERQVTRTLARLGWRLFDGKDQCPDCAEEADADQATN